MAAFVIYVRSLLSGQLSLDWTDSREMRSQVSIEEICPEGILFPLNAVRLNLKSNFMRIIVSFK